MGALHRHHAAHRRAVQTELHRQELSESPDVDERVSGGASAGLLRDDDRHGRRAAEPGAALAGRTRATVNTRRNGQPSKRARKEGLSQFPANRERLAAVFAPFVPHITLIPCRLRPSSANSETHQELKTATPRVLYDLNYIPCPHHLSKHTTTIHQQCNVLL